MAVPETTVAPQVDALEARLRRIEYALTGNTAEGRPQSPPAPEVSTASGRLRTLERHLQAVASRSQTVDEILRLQAEHPQVFAQGLDQHGSPALPPASLAALVLSHTQLYQRLSTQLASLQDSSVPDPAPASKLQSLQPRIEKAAARQDEQARELAELRLRSATAIEQWYTAGIMDMGERWAEWEERVRDVEILVRRMEAAKRREAGTV